MSKNVLHWEYGDGIDTSPLPHRIGTDDGTDDGTETGFDFSNASLEPQGGAVSDEP